MSHYTPAHARDGQRRDAVAAWWHGTWTRLRRLASPSLDLRMLAAEITAIRACLPAPAPDVMDPAQETPRTGDPRSDAREVRSGATTPDPHDDPARLRRAIDSVLNWADPAPHAAAGQAQDPALGRAPEAAATTTQSGGAAALPLPPAFPVAAGQGQRPQGQPRYWDRGDGTRTVIGYGPRCEMPAYRGDYRPTQPFRVVGDAQVVDDVPVRPYYAIHLASLDARAVRFR